MIQTKGCFGLARGLALTGVLLITSMPCAMAQSKPDAHTHPATMAAPTGVIFSGRVAPNLLPTTAWFEWGTNGFFGSSTATIEVGVDWNATNVSATVTNAAIGEAYQFRLVCSNALGVSAGLSQRFVTRGTALGWGRFGQSQGSTTMSRDWNHHVTIAAGYYHTMTLDYDGQAAVYGRFRTLANSENAHVPAGISNIVAIGSGWDHCLAVAADRKVLAWGGSKASAGQTNVPAGLSNVITVAGGELHSLALRDDGTVTAWGNNSSLQINVPSGLSNVVAIAAGGRHNLALRNNGIVTAWGSNLSGKSTIPLGLSNVVAVAAGAEHSMALKVDGNVVLWGSNNYGQTTLPAGLSNVVAIAAGLNNCMALKQDGTVVVWGDGSIAINGSFTNLGNVVALACGYLHAAVVRASASVPPRAAIPFVNKITATSAGFDGFATPNGFNSMAWFEWGTVGDGYTHTTSPVNVGDGVHIVRVKTDVAGLVEGGRFQCRLVVSNEVGVSTSWERRFTTGSKLAAWGYDYDGQGSTRVPPGLTNAVAMDGARGHVIVLKNDGTVIAWGLNDRGQTNVPAGLTNVLDVSASGWHSLALKQDETVAAWGRNSAGETNVPSGLSNVVQVVAGGWHSAALKEDGTVVVWGGNFFAPGVTNLPPNLLDVTAIATSGDHLLALRSDGMVFAWGAPNLINDTYIPLSISALDVGSFSAGAAHNVALCDDGSVVRWGGFTNAIPPNDLTNAIAVAAGWDHSLALRSDGTVAAWTPAGYNNYGQINVPPGLSNVVAIAAGENFSLALGSEVPYVIAPGAFTGFVNTDLVVPLPALDPNGDPLTYRIASLPATGALYQYVAGARGLAITSPNTVEDAWGRVIFAPGLNGLGTPYATFNYLVNEGVADSSPAQVTVNIVMPSAPQLVSASSGWSTNVPSAFELRFTGNTNATYSAYGSTNLVNWERLGWATKSSNGVFMYLDTTATNWPQRFYRAGAP
jgi:alpha-tubulin suppressor-like RCC1 family protein